MKTSYKKTEPSQNNKNADMKTNNVKENTFKSGKNSRIIKKKINIISENKNIISKNSILNNVQKDDNKIINENSIKMKKDNTKKEVKCKNHVENKSNKNEQSKANIKTNNSNSKKNDKFCDLLNSSSKIFSESDLNLSKSDKTKKNKLNESSFSIISQISVFIKSK